jgi:protein phosphatase
MLIELCTAAIAHLQRQLVLLQLRAPIYVTGDIHGNLFDLVRLLVLANLPPASRFVFLGDYVDRGDYSLEVTTLLLALMIANPGYVLLLRGNHEFHETNADYGFRTEILNSYCGDELFTAFNEVFAWLPMAAVINSRFLCVHGGLSPRLRSLADIAQLERPILTLEQSPLATDLVWSDPTTSCPMFQESIRGQGTCFGIEAMKKFFAETGISTILRAHQCVHDGIDKWPGGMLYTVFSSSNYASTETNRCGLLFVRPSLEIETFSLPPGFTLPRKQATFRKVSANEAAKRPVVKSPSLQVRWTKPSTMGPASVPPSARRMFRKPGARTVPFLQQTVPASENPW